MNPAEFIVQGAVTADRTLQLAVPADLPIGPVEVTLRPLPHAIETREDWWRYLQRARKVLVERGHRFRNQDEIDAEMAELRSEDDGLRRVVDPDE